MIFYFPPWFSLKVWELYFLLFPSMIGCGGEVWESPTGFLPKFFVSASTSHRSHENPTSHRSSQPPPTLIATIPATGHYSLEKQCRFSKYKCQTKCRSWTWALRRWSNADENSTFHRLSLNCPCWSQQYQGKGYSAETVKSYLGKQWLKTLRTQSNSGKKQAFAFYDIVGASCESNWTEMRHLTRLQSFPYSCPSSLSLTLYFSLLIINISSRYFSISI